ncbi:TfdA family oxidoreductase, putative [Metarhizium acridum CQMa 102]|uniref:TfdA family oxidoreductase, putative n=1 Tax=Metarhizium acridum (strain CQMa 102) TaxID=655827 RepID=E9E5E1_METAQ|nr:TfdA family oxidoreductase, putative [Metarhizium acridum CQMa 102]EFY88824.1 TfdA family oxidoreductase, putative [Metarhizium acridum CQMa 102]
MAATTASRTGPLGQPDIAYTPNWDTYQERIKRRQETEKIDRTLPDGFPQKLESSLAWTGATVTDEYDWSYELNQSELKEIQEALDYFKSLNKPLGEISQLTFPLPKLHPRLRSISADVHNGHGFKVIRGIPVDKYTREENIIIYAGIASHVANIRGRQDHEYNGRPADVVLAHVKDLSTHADAKSIGSPAYTTEKQVFHTDAGDVIALFALAAAAEGGESFLSSSWTVYNELAATRPDLIRTLAEPWDVDGFGKTGPPGYLSRPLLYYQPAENNHPERVVIQYARRSFTGYWGLPRSANIPAITEAQAEALDAVHFTAEKHALALEFRPGDIQFVNNLSIFHARGGFRDSPEKQRHLIRLWLRDEELHWDTPAALQSTLDRVYGNVTAENQVFPLEPSIRSASYGTKAKQEAPPLSSAAVAVSA